LEKFDSLIGDFESGTLFSLTANGDKVYCAAKFNRGDLVGYKETALTFPGDLIANPGESITSILDKIL
jgi:hypothetical protein